MSDTLKILYNAVEIQNMVVRVTESLENILKDTLQTEDDITVMCVLNGGFMFYTDLIKDLTWMNVRCAFCRVKSYKGTKRDSIGVLMWPSPDSFQDKVVVVVDDILDSGDTAEYLVQKIETHRPKQVIYVSALKRETSRSPKVPTITGFTLADDSYVVGYGLDHNGKYRNFKNIYQLQRDV
jgi:hypoxanthine phosphoribosyltransferase